MGVTLYFQTTGTVPGNGAPVVMVGRSLTIGRGPENDVCLPDPGKVISKTHCSIEENAGDVVLIDLSTNGTFLNYGKVPLGRTPTPLNDGDILTLGSYELLVEIQRPRDADAGLLPPLDIAGPARLPEDADFDALLGSGPMEGGDDFLDDLLGGDAPPRGPVGVNRPELGEDGLLPPLGDDDAGLPGPAPVADPSGGAQSAHSDAVSDTFRPAKVLIPDDWEDDLLGDPVLSGPDAGPDAGPDFDEGAFWDDDASLDEPAPEPAPAPEPEPEAQPLTEVTKAPPPPVTEPSAPPAHADAARAFLDAAGAGDLAIADADLPATMARLGTVMQTMIHGLREILMTRASIKSEFRIQQTMISAGGNNPLKFSISPEQAVETMVRAPAKGYLPPEAAARQALDDIKAHEVAMMAAMEAALKGILKQLSPEVLEAQITKGGGLSGLLQGKKARYWDVYETMYARISDQAETDFHELFSREFARAYQAQLDRLK